MNQYINVITEKVGIQFLGPRLCGKGRRKHLFLMLTSFLSIVLATTACGFHLRGTGKVDLSPMLATLRVSMEDGRHENAPLPIAVKNALRTQTNVNVVEEGDAPRLELYGERFDSQVLSVSSIGKVDEYLLKYEVRFKLLGGDGSLLSESQVVKVQRDHAFDRLNVLSNERQEIELRGEMQRDAVQQILRRLSRIKLEKIDADQP